MTEKVWPVVLRENAVALDVLAFRHPQAGKQFVKGTIEPGELPAVAAVRELREESGIALGEPMKLLGAHMSTLTGDQWHFYSYQNSQLPQRWTHQTEDDCGHLFSFFWHPTSKKLDEEWHPIFHEAFRFFASRI